MGSTQPQALLCIMGPTASGKTALAIALAECMNAELVSVDSALVYRGLDIGSAKPTFPHHLIDICDPGEVYSAARFVTDASAVIAEIEARGKRPILVGGSMLYFRALLMGLDPLPEADPILRAELELRAAEEGLSALHKELERLDPVSAARIHPNHSQRLIRALEVCRLSGQPMSSLHRQDEAQGSTNQPVIALGLTPTDRQVLHQRIEQRFDQMLRDGFLAEVERLRARGDLHGGLPSMRAVGYRQLWSYLEGECSLEEAIHRAIVATRQLAKRQLTWLRKWPDLQWLETDAAGNLVKNGLVEGHNRRDQQSAGCGEMERNLSDEVLNYLKQNPMV